ncbi:hypothetical protein C8R43DRAFT_1140303 [Mycena crocata]|nr:hypothetical protein C8R43DRAFT_1140303 [Mycena crocata]
MPANVNFTPDFRNSTPSPGLIEQPSSGPNPIFESPPKRRGGQFTSVKAKRRKMAQKEEESWTPEQTAAEGSRRMQDKLAEAAAEKATREQAAADRAERERTQRVHNALAKLKEAGCSSTYQFFEDFFSSTDREISRQASRLMGDNGEDLLDLISTSPSTTAAAPGIIENCVENITRRNWVTFFKFRRNICVVVAENVLKFVEQVLSVSGHQIPLCASFHFFHCVDTLAAHCE